jgi:hypothetical protein
VPLWQKRDQSKITNYAKQTQFFKKSNVYNHNCDNKLQREMNNGHLVKTNPIKPNLVPSVVEGSIKTITGLGGGGFILAGGRRI